MKIFSSGRLRFAWGCAPRLRLGAHPAPSSPGGASSYRPAGSSSLRSESELGLGTTPPLAFVPPSAVGLIRKRSLALPVARTPRRGSAADKKKPHTTRSAGHEGTATTFTRVSGSVGGKTARPRPPVELTGCQCLVRSVCTAQGVRPQPPVLIRSDLAASRRSTSRVPTAAGVVTTGRGVGGHDAGLRGGARCKELDSRARRGWREQLASPPVARNRWPHRTVDAAREGPWLSEAVKAFCAPARGVTSVWASMLTKSSSYARQLCGGRRSAREGMRVLPAGGVAPRRETHLGLSEAAWVGVE